MNERRLGYAPPRDQSPSPPFGGEGRGEEAFYRTRVVVREGARPAALSSEGCRRGRSAVHQPLDRIRHKADPPNTFVNQEEFNALQFTGSQEFGHVTERAKILCLFESRRPLVAPTVIK